MAEDKKTFVAYADWEGQFNLLSDEEAGKLIKHIFLYVNDQNPTFSDEERLLIMAFEPIKRQLKRDLKKYETIKEKRRIAGQKGGAKSAEIREEATNQNEAKQAKQANATFAKQIQSNEANDFSEKPVKQKQANQADNVNGNVNDNGNVNVYFYLGGKIHKKKISEYLNSKSRTIIEQFMMTIFRGMDLEEIYKSLDEEYNGTEFRDDNHIRNSFKSIAKKIQSKNLKEPKTNVTFVIGQKPTGYVKH